MNPSALLSALTAVDLRILDALMEQQGRVTSRDTLMRLAAVDSLASRRVDVSIVALRKVLGPESIITVRQRGWMLTPVGLREAEMLVSGEVNMTP
jgi:DNA-binding response OmpR family regulator